MVELEADAAASARSRRRSRRSSRSSRTSSRTSRTGRLHALGDEASAAAGARGRARLHDLRGRPVRRRSASRARRSRRCSSRTTAGRVVYASSFSKTVCPGIRVGYLVGPQAIIKQIQTLATNTYISPNMVAQSIVNQFARSGRMDGAIATVKNALRDRRDAVVTALERELPEAKFARPEGGYFMWVELPEARRRGRAREGRGRARSAVRQGHGLPARGRPEHAAPGLLGRDAGADRRGHHEAGRGRAVAWASQRHNYGDDPSQYGVLYGEGPVAVLIHGGFWNGRVRPDADGRAVPRTSRRAAGRRGTSSTGGSATAAACRRRSTTSAPRSTTWPTLDRGPARAS